jgi:hypothetical protein
MNYSLGNMLSGSKVLGPALNLQFATDQSLTARRGPTPVFTRASTATFVGSDGLIQSAAINAPRFDYDPVTLACKGLLIEESNTNYALRSQELTHAAWQRFGVLSATAVASPDGGTNATRIISSVAISTHVALQKTAQNAIGNYCVTVFAKPAGYNWLTLLSTNTGNNSAVGASFNLATGAVGATTVVNGTLLSAENADAGGGWRRIKVCYTHTNTTGNGIQLYMSNANGVISFLGDGTSGIDFYGAEIKPTQPDSYIPTIASAATRSADVCTLTIPAGVSSILITYDDNTTATVSVTPGGSYQLPSSQKKYKSIVSL